MRSSHLLEQDAPSNADDVEMIDEATEIRSLAEAIAIAAEQWRHELTVSIGQARKISGLKEAQIRYYETIGALSPAKSSETAGASRRYSLLDLRRLCALASLSRRRRPAEAAKLMLRHVDLIENGPHPSVNTIAGRERNTLADGFFLARLASQLIQLLQASLDANAPTPSSSPLVFGLIFRGEAQSEHIFHCVPEVVPAHALFALHQSSPSGRGESVASALPATTGYDDQTVIFYGESPLPLDVPAGARRYCYAPAGHPEQLLEILVAPGTDGAALPEAGLFFLDEQRAEVLDRLLALFNRLFENFRALAGPIDYRFRSDGFPIALTRRSYVELLATIRDVIFPPDSDSIAVLLIPDSIDQPRSLLILAHVGYNPDLASQVRLPLGDDGQGLCGKAYLLREPFVSLHADTDNRVAYGPEEASRVAMAVPLATSWGLSPFGVLYLASRDKDAQLPSTTAFFALILGSILSELLGRWWLTRLRRELDAQLHGRITQMIGWLDSLDECGPSFKKGLEAIRSIWKRLPENTSTVPDGYLTLTVLDIVGYRENVQRFSNEPLPVQAQQHVEQAVARAIGPNTPCFWFRNDHALLLLDGHDAARAEAKVQGLIELVSAAPLLLSDGRALPRVIAVRQASQTISYRSLRHLAGPDGSELDTQMTAIISWLRDVAGGKERTMLGAAGPGFVSTSGISLPLRR